MILVLVCSTAGADDRQALFETAMFDADRQATQRVLQRRDSAPSDDHPRPEVAVATDRLGDSDVDDRISKCLTQPDELQGRYTFAIVEHAPRTYRLLTGADETPDRLLDDLDYAGTFLPTWLPQPDDGSTPGVAIYINLATGHWGWAAVENFEADDDIARFVDELETLPPVSAEWAPEAVCRIVDVFEDLFSYIDDDGLVVDADEIEEQIEQLQKRRNKLDDRIRQVPGLERLGMGLTDVIGETKSQLAGRRLDDGDLVGALAYQAYTRREVDELEQRVQALEDAGDTHDQLSHRFDNIGTMTKIRQREWLPYGSRLIELHDDVRRAFDELDDALSPSTSVSELSRKQQAAEEAWDLYDYERRDTEAPFYLGAVGLPVSIVVVVSLMVGVKKRRERRETYRREVAVQQRVNEWFDDMVSPSKKADTLRSDIDELLDEYGPDVLGSVLTDEELQTLATTVATAEATRQTSHELGQLVDSAGADAIEELLGDDIDLGDFDAHPTATFFGASAPSIRRDRLPERLAQLVDETRLLVDRAGDELADDESDDWTDDRDAGDDSVSVW